MPPPRRTPPSMTDAEREARERERGERLVRLETKVDRLIEDFEDFKDILALVPQHEQRLNTYQKALWMIAGALASAIVGTMVAFVFNGGFRIAGQ